jgi:Membrane domain of glycerophosphoryl diester phosphodiesterase
MPPWYGAPAPPPYGAPPPPPYGAPPPPPYGGYGGGYGGYGGYGPYGGYGKPPAPKPGLIPLRPLTAGEILDGAFTAIRWNPKTILVSSAVVAAASNVLLGVATYILDNHILASVHVPANGPVTAAQVGNFAIALFALLGVTAVVTFVANTIVTGLLTYAIGQGVLGRKETLGGAWRATRSRLGALFATVLLASVCLGLGWMLAIGLSVGIGVLLGVGAHAPAVGVLVGLACGGTATVFAAIILIRWTVALPVVMLERAGPVASLRRSWGLVRRSSWRVLGIMLATELIVAIAGAVIKLPFGLASGAGNLFTASAHVSVLGIFASSVGGIVASTLTAPMLAGVVVLLYTDLRMRREGLDITLQAAAGVAGGAAGAVPGGDADGRNAGPW